MGILFLINTIYSFKEDAFSPISLFLSTFFLIFPLVAVYVYFAYKPKNPRGLSVSKDTAPEIFKLIEECSKKAGAIVEFDSIILTPGISVSVNYAPSLPNFFKDTKATLYIGVALCHYLSINELSAVLVHEFAHLHQPQTKFKGYLARISNTATKLGRNGEFGSNGYLNTIGISTSLLTRVVLYIFNHSFDLISGIIYPSYNKVTEEMELDADKTSADCFGAKNMLSALSKSIVISKRLALYKHLILPYLSSIGYRCEGFWKTFEDSSPLFKAIDGLEICDNRLIFNLEGESADSLDPLLTLRLDSLKNISDNMSQNQVSEPSITIIPDEIMEKMDKYLCKKYGQTRGIKIGYIRFNEILNSLRNTLFSNVHTMEEAYLVVNELFDDINATKYGVIQTIHPSYIHPSYDMTPQPIFKQASEDIYSTYADTCPVCGYKVNESTKICPHCHEIIAE